MRVPRSGVSYTPLLEQVFAAVWANHTPEGFWEKSGEYQSIVVAAYRSHLQIEAVLANEQAKKSKAEADKSKG